MTILAIMMIPIRVIIENASFLSSCLQVYRVSFSSSPSSVLWLPKNHSFALSASAFAGFAGLFLLSDFAGLGGFAGIFLLSDFAGLTDFGRLFLLSDFAALLDFGWNLGFGGLLACNFMSGGSDFVKLFVLSDFGRLLLLSDFVKLLLLADFGRLLLLSDFGKLFLLSDFGKLSAFSFATCSLAISMYCWRMLQTDSFVSFAGIVAWRISLFGKDT